MSMSTSLVNDPSLEMITLVNASTHHLRFQLNSPMGLHRLSVEPLKAVQVFKNWTIPNLDSLGRPVLKSTIEQNAPLLKPEGHPDLIKARQSLTNAKLRADGKPLPDGVMHPYLEWPPTKADLEAEREARKFSAAVAAAKTSK